MNFKENCNIEQISRLTMYELAEILFPIPRSLTGSGIRKSFDIFRDLHPEFKTFTFKTGQKVGDWEIPEEWEIYDGYIELESGKRICEFNKCNLSIVGYSTPINAILSLDELTPHLHYRKDLPNAVPYVTSYYKKYWGFCLKYELFKTLKNNEKYKCVINSQLKPGSLELIEAIIPSKSKQQKDIFFSSYLCHPSMANNELSGPVVLNQIIKYVKTIEKRKYNYRFVLLPETIGSIAYLSENSEELKEKVICGFNLTCCGDRKKYTHTQSPFGDNLTDQALRAALIGMENVFTKSFIERGSDERQYCSPNVNLPICSFSRSKFGDYTEYHTSLDNLNFISEEGLQGSFFVMKTIIDALELGLYPVSKTIGEPQLGKKGLYNNLSNHKAGNKRPCGIRSDILAYCNGRITIFDIAIITKIPLKIVIDELNLLFLHQLIELRSN